MEAPSPDRTTAEPLSAEHFLKHLADSGLMSAEEIQACVAPVPAAVRADARQLAQELVRREKLTRYQAAMLVQGKPKGLVLGNYSILDKLGLEGSSAAAPVGGTDEVTQGFVAAGSHQPEAFRLGLYYMHGNVWEWCQDEMPGDPKAPKAASQRVRRGGSWNIDSEGSRVAHRRTNPPAHRDGSLGLRLARVPVGSGNE